MPRIRTIKPIFWGHEDMSEMPEATQLLAIGLLNYADDEGYFNANPKLIKATCCPLREPSVSIHDSLTHLSKIAYLRLGTGEDGKRYGHIVNFGEHQRVNRPNPSKIKNLNIVWEDSVNTHTQVSEGSHPEGKGREGTTEGNKEGNKERRSAPADAAAPAVSDSQSQTITDPPGDSPSPTDSAEDRFWALAEKAKAVKIGKGMMGKVINKIAVDAEEALSILEDSLGKREPHKYLGRIVANREQRGNGASGSADEPEFVRESRREGMHVEPLPDGGWKIGTKFYDAEGAVVGW